MGALDPAQRMRQNTPSAILADALLASYRKLLIFANTVVTRGTPWTERTAEA